MCVTVRACVRACACVLIKKKKKKKKHKNKREGKGCLLCIVPYLRLALAIGLLQSASLAPPAELAAPLALPSSVPAFRWSPRQLLGN